MSTTQAGNTPERTSNDDNWELIGSIRVLPGKPLLITPPVRWLPRPITAEVCRIRFQGMPRATW